MNTASAREWVGGTSITIGVTKLAWMYDRSRDWAARVLSDWEQEQLRGGPVRVFRTGRVLATTMAVVHRNLPAGKELSLYGIDESTKQRRTRLKLAPAPAPALVGEEAWPAASGVYFVRAGDFVKVGRADNVRTRLTSIQCHQPVDIVLLAVHLGHGDEEADYHALFARFHVRGEWFRWCDEIASVVEAVREGGFVPPGAPKRAVL